MPVLADHGTLPAAAIEAVAADYAAIAAGGEAQVTVRLGGAEWKRTILGQWFSSLHGTSARGKAGRKARREAGGEARGKALVNVAAVLLADDHPFTAAQLEQAFDHAATCFASLTPAARLRRRWTVVAS